MIKRHFFAKTLIVLPFLLTAAEAQQDATLVQVLTAQVKPGMEPQFEEVVKAYRDASRDQSIENYWLSAQAISGEPAYRFHVQLSGWGDLSTAEPQLTETFGEQEATRLMGLIQDSVVSMHTAFYQQSQELSNPRPESSTPPEALVYIDFTLNAGGLQQWQELTMKTAEAFRAVRPDYHFVAAMPSMGASGPRTILIMDSMSDLDSPAGPPGQAVLEHFGEQEGESINQMAESIESFEYSLWRTRPDLDYQPVRVSSAP